MGGSPVTFELLEPRLLLSAGWTVMVYLDGDNNLEAAALDDVNEMEAVGSTAAMNVLVQLDRIGGYDKTNGNWTDTRRGRVIADGDPETISTTFTSIGEVNMGLAANLTAFVQWGAAAYPADRYAVILWDHGGGTSGVCWDDTSDDHLTVSEVGTALAAAGVHVELIGFDACLMAMMETAAEVRAHGAVMVAAEQTEPWDGWPYDTFLADLAADPGQSGGTLAAGIVARYGASYGGAETLSAVDLGAVGPLAADLDTFAGTVMAEDTDWGAISAARTGASYYSTPDFRDLGSFLDGVVAEAADADIVAAATGARASYDAAVLANHSGPGEGASGLSIYLPAQGGTVSGGYTGASFAFAAETRWDEFLEAFVASDGAAADVDGSIPDAASIGSPPVNVNAHVGLDGATSVGGRDVDVYAVPVTAGRMVGFDIDAVENGSSLDAMLRLFDASGVQLARNDDAHDPDSNAYSYDPYIEHTFGKSETIYIGVSGYDNASYDPWTAGSGSAGSTGPYRLRIRDLGGGGDDPDGTISTAVDLGSVPVSYEGAVGDEAAGARDVDFYALHVETNQAIAARVAAEGSGLDGYLRLFTSGGAVLAQNDDTYGADPALTYDFSALGAGTYYLGVSGSPNGGYDPFVAGSGSAGSTGSYRLTVEGASVHEDFDGTIPLAQPVAALPAYRTGTIGDEPAGALDVDCYGVPVSAGQTVGFDVDAAELGYGFDALLRLFDAAGTELAVSEDATDPDSGLASSDPYIRHTFGAAGTYYVAVSGSPNDAYAPFVEVSGIGGDTGGYTLRIRGLGSLGDTNGTLATAGPVIPPAVVSAEVGDEPAGDLDVDLYRFTVTAGQSAEFDIDADEAGSGLDAVVRLFDAAGTELAWNDDGVDPDTGAWSLDPWLRYDFDAAGTYFLGVSGYRNWAYDPQTALSGRSGSTGPYDLGVTVVEHGPDLAAALDSSKLPFRVLPGDKKRGVLKKVPLVLTNRGDREARGVVTMDLYASTDAVLGKASDTKLGQVRADVKLRPGKSKKVKFSKLALPDLGEVDCYLIAEINAGGGIVETNEGNNVAASGRTIAWERPYVDLTGEIDERKLPVSVRPGDRKEGWLKKVRVLVGNQGNIDALGAVRLDLYASGDETLDPGSDALLDQAVARLKLRPGKAKKLKFSKLAVPVLPAGEYHLLVAVDAADAVAESDEGNNVAVSGRPVEWLAGRRRRPHRAAPTFVFRLTQDDGGEGRTHRDAKSGL
jgi:hypothetical protein